MSFSFTKYQIEEVSETVDFSGLAEIQNGEVIASCTVEISKNGLLDDTGMLVGTPTKTDSTVTFRVKGGSVNTSYLIVIVITTDNNHVRQTEVTMGIL